MSDNSFFTVCHHTAFNFDFSPVQLGRPNSEMAAILSDAVGDYAEACADFADALGRLGSNDTTRYALGRCAPVSPPAVEDSCHPAGGLRTDDSGVITTPGGYRIEMLGQYEWKITGPDGKWTRVHGDPHVDEGDRDGSCDWDFKRDTTFVLGDGTRVNVTTVPGGAAGMTVTGALEVVSGGQSVSVTGIDKGKGVVGEVGYHSSDNFTGDVVVMGAETDDWSFRGREIRGSRDGGDSFVLGDAVRQSGSNFYEAAFRFVLSRFEDFVGRWGGNSGWRPNEFGCNPYAGYNRPIWETNDRADRRELRDMRRYAESMADAFRALADMFDALARLSRLSEQLSSGRYNRRWLNV